MDFKDFKLKDDLQGTLITKGFLTPTKIQEKFIPLALSGKDILAKSETGSGKTLAYTLSILNSITNDGVGALIVAPTKELVLQIKEVIKEFTKHLNLNVVSITGGSDFTRQRLNLKTANIVVGTTGRLLDHLERRTLKLHKLKFLVLDEADVMLDMGFIDDIDRIEKACPRTKQIFMLSATFNDKVKILANKYLKNPEIIEMTKDNKIVENIEQCYILCLKKGKFETLLKFVKTLYKEKTIIFCNTKKMAEEIYKKLKTSEIKSEYINGDLSFAERKKVINNFKSFNNNLLIATDVASRGLDIDNVEYIINYDIPENFDSYIHRIGRTARAGKSGLSLSLINTQKQLDFFKENLQGYKLTELKVKKDDRTNQTIFVKTNTQNFDFDKEINFKKNKQNKENKISKNNNKKHNKNLDNKQSFKKDKNKKLNNKNSFDKNKKYNKNDKLKSKKLRTKRGK